MKHEYTFTTITTSQFIADIPIEVIGFLARGTAAGDTATIYDGQNEIMGGLFSTLTVDNAYSNNFPLSAPVLFDRGLYVLFSSNMKEVTVVWRPLPPDDPTLTGMIKVQEQYVPSLG